MVGYGAGYSIDVPTEPWSKHFNMHSYTYVELPIFISKMFEKQIDHSRWSIMGHSMGGGGALLIAAKNPHSFKSVSALAPRCSPSNPGSTFGHIAYSIYFNNDVDLMKRNDATEVLNSRHNFIPCLVDQGTKDELLE